MGATKRRTPSWLYGSVEVCQTLPGSVGMDSAGLPEAGGVRIGVRNHLGVPGARQKILNRRQLPNKKEPILQKNQ